MRHRFFNCSLAFLGFTIIGGLPFYSAHAEESLNAYDLSEALAHRSYAHATASAAAAPVAPAPSQAPALPKPVYAPPAPVAGPVPAATVAPAVAAVPLVAPSSAAVAEQPRANWQGSYVGLQFGYGVGTARRDFLQADGGSTGNFAANGLNGGITVGHNEQFGKVVAGLEGDLSASGNSGSTQHPNTNYNYTTQNSWLMTLRPRLGYDFGKIMPYATAGLAVGDIRTGTYLIANGVPGSDFTRVEAGWTAGGGVEAALSPRWSAKAEYLYVDLGEATGPSSIDQPTRATFAEHIGRVGLNYKFDQPDDGSEPFALFAAEGRGGSMGLATFSGVTLGGQISDYHYQEHVDANAQFMQENGAKFGGSLTAIKAFHQGTFVSGDVRLAYSSNRYSTPSYGKNDVPDYLGEARFLLGQDFLLRSAVASQGEFDLSPYAGVGYRNLYNDLRGSQVVTFQVNTNTITETVKGYRRDSEYLYLPVGVTSRFHVGNSSRISTTLEYDRLLQGWQRSDLSDVEPSQPNLVNSQVNGYGLRGDIMYEIGRWSVGPFFDYWNIDQSAYTISAGYYSDEPHNQTIEYGWRAGYRF